MDENLSDPTCENLRQEEIDKKLCEEIMDVLPDPTRANLRQKEKDKDLCNKIMDVLRTDGPQRVLLAGKAGIGKTRLAKMVAECDRNKRREDATDKRYCFLTLCLHLNKKFTDEWSLYVNIASQLSVYPDFEESEVDDRDEDEEEEKKAKDLEDLKKKITGEIEKREKAAIKMKELAVETKKATKKKDEPANKKGKTQTEKEKTQPEEVKETYLLLILDDEGSMTKEAVVMTNLNLKSFLADQILKDYKRLKILITRKEDEEPKKTDEVTDTKGNGSRTAEEGAKSDSDSGPEEDKISEEGTESQATGGAPASGQSVPPTGDGSQAAAVENGDIPTDMSQALLDSINESSLRDLFLSLVEADWKTDEKLISSIVKKSKNSPAAIFVLANSLNQITRSKKYNPGKEKIETLIKTFLSADRSDQPNVGSSSEKAINPILCLAYKLLETGFALKEAILDCFWHSLDFFQHCGCVYYRDLITQWILEGYFDPVRSVEKAYKDGHDILMELINRGILKIQENNVVVPERAMRNLLDPRRRGLFGRSRLRFSRVYCGDKEKGIGKITQIDDMIKTVQAKKGDKISTILVSGDRLRRETPVKFFKMLGDLEVLGLFQPTLEPFVPSFSKLLKLRVLVIRDCDLLTDIKELKAFKRLHALEVSGASSLKEISHDFFSGMKELQSLHLSGLQITSSPSSISELAELHCLIIKDCPLLEDLPDIQELVKLEVVDISGARGLQTCFDNTKGEKKNKSKNKNFYKLEKLQHLDFSESQIERLPIFQDSAVGAKLHSLTRLLLRNCSKLRRLPSLKPLSGLQILDLSGTTSLVEMLEVCYEDKPELKILNLTGTNLGELATTIEDLSNLTELLLKNCNNLEKIPDITKLTNLEVIDVSGCTKLHKIEGSFEEMYYLREIDLSGTKVMIPPQFPEKTFLIGQKRITLADKRSFEGKDWEEVKNSMPSEIFEGASSSDTAVKPQEISEKGSEEIREIQPNEPRASDYIEKGERLLQVPIDRDIYNNILSLFDDASQRDFMKIHESKDLRGEAEANAEFVFCEYIDSTRLKSIFSKNRSVKVCSLRMCMDIKDLFSGVDEESLGSLETVSIINFPSLETISWGSSFKNLKNLNVEGCPKIKTLFPKLPNKPEVPKLPNNPEVPQQSSKKEVTHQLPSTLEVLHIKNCEKLEKVVEGVELSTLTNPTLTWKVENCPNFTGATEGSGWEMVEHPETSQQD